jgi:hypothetical protein
MAVGVGTITCGSSWAIEWCKNHVKWMRIGSVMVGFVEFWKSDFWWFLENGGLEGEGGEEHAGGQGKGHGGEYLVTKAAQAPGLSNGARIMPNGCVLAVLWLVLWNFGNSEIVIFFGNCCF